MGNQKVILKGVIDKIAKLGIVRKKGENTSKLKYFIAVPLLVISLGYISIYGYNELSAYNLNKSLAERYDTYTDSLEETADNDLLSEIDNSLDALMPVENEDNAMLLSTVEGEEREPLDVLPAMRAFFKENRDTVGWIKVGGTKINNVVVQTKDNDFYLHNDFTKHESQPGTIFADYRCNVSDYNDLQSRVIILYGHKQANGTMFGTLHKYNNNLDFYKEHPTFKFNNLFEEYDYKIVGMFVIAVNKEQTIGGEVFDYQNYINFEEEGKYTFYNFINNIKSRSQVNTPVDIRLNDNFLILSTCSYEFNDARFIVVGRRVRDGESLDVDVDKATVNKTRKEPRD